MNRNFTERTIEWYTYEIKELYFKKYQKEC